MLALFQLGFQQKSCPSSGDDVDGSDKEETDGKNGKTARPTLDRPVFVQYSRKRDIPRQISFMSFAPKAKVTRSCRQQFCLCAASLVLLISYCYQETLQEPDWIVYTATLYHFTKNQNIIN